MLTSKIVFMTLAIGLAGCLKAQKKADENTDAKPNSNTPSAQDPGTSVVNTTNEGSGSSSQGNNQGEPLLLVNTQLSLSLNLLAPGTTAEKPTVYADISGLVASKCVACHSASNRTIGDLSQLPFQFGNRSQDVIRAEIGKRIKVQGAGMMPPAYAKQLTDKEKDAILDWINDGGLESYVSTATALDLKGYKARIQYKSDATAMTEWQTLPAFTNNLTSKSLGAWKAGSNLVANISVIGPSGAEILVKAFDVVIPASGVISLPLQATAEDIAVQQPAVVPAVPSQPSVISVQPPVVDPATPAVTPAQPPVIEPVVDVAYPNCPTGPMSPEGIAKWRNQAALQAAQAEQAADTELLKKISRRIDKCFPTIPACMQRTYDLAAKEDTADSGELDIETEAKKLPKEFHSSNFNPQNPRYVIPADIEAQAKSNGWLTARYKSRHAGGFDAGSSNLLMIYVPGDKVSPPVSFDRWINIAFDADPIKDVYVPAPASTPALKFAKENTFTLVSLDRKVSDRPATVYFQMFSRVKDTNTFRTGHPDMSKGLKFCAKCHPNGLRAISPLGYHIRDNQQNMWADTALDLSTELRSLVKTLYDRELPIQDLPAREASLPDEDWQAVKAMNDAMDIGAGGAAVSWGEGKVGTQTKPLFVANGYGPVVGPLAPLNGKSRSKDFIMGNGSTIKGCFKKREYVHVEDVFKRPTGTHPNNLAILSPDAENKIDWQKVSKAMECANCHDGVKRGALNSVTGWEQIDFKILVDQSMPQNMHINPLDPGANGQIIDLLNSDERLALANCLLAEYELEKKKLKDWQQEQSCQ